MSHEVLSAGNTEALGPELRMEGGVAVRRGPPGERNRGTVVWK